MPASARITQAAPKPEKLAILKAELANPRPLLAPNIDLPDVARELLDTLDVIQDIASKRARLPLAATLSA